MSFKKFSSAHTESGKHTTTDKSKQAAPGEQLATQPVRKPAETARKS